MSLFLYQFKLCSRGYQSLFYIYIYIYYTNVNVHVLLPKMCTIFQTFVFKCTAQRAFRVLVCKPNRIQSSNTLLKMSPSQCCHYRLLSVKQIVVIVIFARLQTNAALLRKEYWNNTRTLSISSSFHLRPLLTE